MIGLVAIALLMQGIPSAAAMAPLALYLADTGWTLLRRIRSDESWSEPHRSHTYQRLCHRGWSHQRMTMTTAATTMLLCLLGLASLSGHPALRVAADLAGMAVLATYLRCPVLLGRSRALAVVT